MQAANIIHVTAIADPLAAPAAAPAAAAVAAPLPVPVAAAIPAAAAVPIAPAGVPEPDQVVRRSQRPIHRSKKLKVRVCTA